MNKILESLMIYGIGNGMGSGRTLFFFFKPCAATTAAAAIPFFFRYFLCLYKK
jgi:hypothetical protein